MVYVGELCVEHPLKPVLTLIQAGFSCKWTHDSQRFLLEFFDTIHKSPCQIYHLALPFSPSSSWIHKCYAAEFSREVRVVKGLPAEWGTCSRTITFDRPLNTLAYWKGTIAVGSESGDIIILNAITGSQVALLSGHTSEVDSLAFSLDGKSLVSGSDDETLKLWDVQTGGVVKTFHGHTDWVYSTSISLDCTTIASGSDDNTIRLWDIQTGECHCIMDQRGAVKWVSFSPTNPQHLISISGGVVQWWDIDGHQIKPTYRASHGAFSSDGTHLVLCGRRITTVQNSDSGAIVAKFPTDSNNPNDDSDDDSSDPDTDSNYCCFSPNGRLVAVTAGTAAYVWDITGSDPHLIETFIGHTNNITSITFSSSSSLVSASWDQSVRFWQIIAPSTDPAASDPSSTPPAPTPIKSVSLQAKNGIVISSDLDGVVKTWDISTGLCKASFQIPVKASVSRDAQMIDGGLIVVWLGEKGIHIWDTKESKLLQVVEVDWDEARDLRISGDGSKVFLLRGRFIQAWSLWTGEAVGKVELEDKPYQDLLCMDGSKVHLRFSDTSTLGWDFGTLDSSPIPLPNTSSEKPCLYFIGGANWWYEGPSWIKDTGTGKEVFWLSGRYARPAEVQWDGQYLAAGYYSGEMLILDFEQVLPQ
jgi:WD40 repeat protein